MTVLGRLIFWHRLSVGLCCFFLSLVFTFGLGAGSSYANPDKTLAVATEPAFPPFEAKSDGGKLEGFDIDLMNAIATVAGYQVKWQSLPFDGMIPALQAGTVDAAISAMTIAPERLQTVTFSRPYFKAGLAIAVRANNTEISNFDSLQHKKIAVQIGTTGANAARKVGGAEVRTFDSAPLALQELLNGNVDAVINDAPVTLYAIKQNNLQGIKVVGELLTEEFYGIAVPQGSANLAPINDGIKTILENKTYAQIYQKWFGGNPPELPEIPAIAAPPSTKQIPFLSSLNVILKALPSLFWGVLLTLQLAFSSVFLGAIGGSLIGIARLSTIPFLSLITRIYVDLFRGTPLLVQIFTIYFGLPALAQEMGLSFKLDRLAAGVVALSLNSAAYIAEIVRGGIQSIDRGQIEAARSLGLGSVQTTMFVVFPQAIRRMLPPLGNEFITLLKDTSLVAVIGLEELFREGQLTVAQNYRSFEIYTTVALIYLALTVVFSQGFSWLEVQMNPIKKQKSSSRSREVDPMISRERSTP